ncbi:VOC family protein [Microtetraspora malaysiensis]|uniref:VOC family protein n=1 Tax=Microtetraspora malaysiensis TaxID=161358 RepID=UPI003D93E3B8
MDFKLEMVPIPVSDVDRAKEFYTEKLGFVCDVDFSNGAFRVVQVTPPGSACSVSFGAGMIDTPPGSIKALHLVVKDIHAARALLVERGVDVAEVEDLSAPGKPTVSYAAFSDPDGNGWTLQQLPY